MLGLVCLGCYIYLFSKFCRNSKYIFNMLIFGFFINIVENYTNYIPIVNLAGIYLYNEDIELATMILWMILNRKLIIRKKLSDGMLWAFILICLGSLVRGTIKYGISSNLIGDFRSFSYLLVPIVFMASYSFQLSDIDIKKYYHQIKIVMVFASIMTYIGCFTSYYLGIIISAIGSEGRPIHPNQMVVVAIFAACNFYFDLVKSKNKCISSVTLMTIIAVILDRYNTAWAVMGIMMILFIIFGIKKRRLLNYKFILQMLVVTGVCILLFRNNLDILDMLSTTWMKFNYTEGEANFTGRTEIWSGVLATLSGSDKFIGAPFGSGYYGIVNGVVWQTSAHSGYVTIIMRAGYIGLVLFCTIFLISIIQSVRSKNVIGVACIIAALFYIFTYNYIFEVFSLVGLVWRITYNPFEIKKVGNKEKI